MNENVKQLREQRAALHNRLVRMQNAALEMRERIERSKLAIDEAEAGIARLDREIAKLQKIEDSN
jgi:peptidoglycan hydrolase CwlO-like protein